MIVVGSRKSAALLTHRLREHDLDAILVCSEPDQHQHALAVGIPSVCTQDSLSEALRRAEVERARTVIAMQEEDEENLRICRMARQVYGVDHVIAWVRDPVQNERFRRLGVQIVNPAYSTVLITEGMVVSPAAFSLTADVDEAREVREIKLQNRSLVGQRLKDVILPGDVIVLMIKRGGDIIVPDRETALRANDVVTLVGAEEDVDRTARFFARDGQSR